jgi:predicted alpha/beta superfamily hydrolase
MTHWLDYEDAYEGGGTRIAGTVKVLRDVKGPEPDDIRDILVYLPPSYATANRTYPAVYMHDGQNLFDPATSFAGEWRVDDSLEELAGDGVEAIVIGIPNVGARRLNEYSPFDDPRFGPGRADDYLRFVVETVKPAVDDEFRTTGQPEGTATMGSSMGGLISLHAFFERPDVFGLVGAVSPSLGFAGHGMIDYLKRVSFRGGRIYMDAGTEEGHPSHPGAYARLVRHACDILVRAGYTEGRNLRFVEDEGGRHNEAAWAARFPDALRFLLD